MNTEADLQAAARHLDAALNLDPETRAARNKIMASLSTVNSAAELWEVYRSTAIAPGTPLVQITETQRTIYWTIAALSQVLAARPEVLQRMLTEVSEYGLSHIQRRLG